MKKTVLVVIAILSFYVLSFFILLLIMLSGVSLQFWVKDIADWIYAPLLFIVDSIFGGIC